jgi:hypothetical protein
MIIFHPSFLNFDRPLYIFKQLFNSNDDHLSHWHSRVTITNGKNVQSRAYRQMLLKRHTIYKLLTLTTIFAWLLAVMYIIVPSCPLLFTSTVCIFILPN